MNRPLAGLRVVELASEIAGPYCTKLLVDLGADVCKIEPPSGDPLRRWGPRSGLFEYLNAGKRGTAIDRADPGNVAAVHEMIAGADVLVESLPVGASERREWGLDAESLDRINPESGRGANLELRSGGPTARSGDDSAYLAGGGGLGQRA